MLEKSVNFVCPAIKLEVLFVHLAKNNYVRLVGWSVWLVGPFGWLVRLVGWFVWLVRLVGWLVRFVRLVRSFVRLVGKFG